MKTKKLVRKIKSLLSADDREQRAKYRSLLEVLAKLEAKELTLAAKLDRESDDAKREKLARKLEVVRAQRAKGELLRARLAAE